MNDGSALGWCVIISVLGFCYALGYAMAHSDVAKECERLGAFYVGSKVFKCEVKKP